MKNIIIILMAAVLFNCSEVLSPFGREDCQTTSLVQDTVFWNDPNSWYPEPDSIEIIYKDGHTGSLVIKNSICLGREGGYIKLGNCFTPDVYCYVFINYIECK